ncbi:MAG TPA: hypothetical protein VEB59_14370 [Gemmatimonadales bacterium]|nr:hypothetical protein [Gemmatimonadales bacterium]
MDALRDLLSDRSFLTSVILLILTAVLTGLLVPILKTRWDEASAERRQRLEAELARQSEFLRAQTELLAAFSDATWAFLFDAFQVSYAEAWEELETQEQVWETYTPASWTHLRNIRAIISKSKRLVSDDCHRSLLDTYGWLVQYDDALAMYQVANHPPKDWEQFHQRYFEEAGKRMDDTIALLATELQLSAESRPAPVGGKVGAVAGRIATR